MKPAQQIAAANPHALSVFSHWKVLEVGRGAADEMVRLHYLHRWPGVAVCVLGLMERYSLIGCVVFALPPRETMKRYAVSLAWELARLFIKDDTPKNAETWFVSRAIRWVKENRPDVQCLVSYADPSAGHQGTIYRAGNWVIDGKTDQERKTPRFDYEDPKTGKRYSRRAHVPDGMEIVRVPRISKFRYVYWLDGSHEKRRQASTVLRRATPPGAGACRTGAETQSAPTSCEG
jgi:hypothetical protein